MLRFLHDLPDLGLAERERERERERDLEGERERDLERSFIERRGDLDLAILSIKIFFIFFIFFYFPEYVLQYSTVINAVA